MKDFRTILVKREVTDSDLAELLTAGLLAKAFRLAKASKRTISEDDIANAARDLFRKGRTGELLSLIGTMEVVLPFSAQELLLRAYELRDYHTFVKQAVRLGCVAGLETQLSAALAFIGERAPIEAAAWRRKLAQ